MITKKRVAAMAVALFITTSMISASAFASATLERDSTIKVVSDSEGLLQLGPGDTDAVTENAAGELEITMDSSTTNGVNGINPTANFQFGDESTLDSASTTSSYVYAFNMSVEDAMTGSGSLSMAYTDSDSNTDDNVQFDVYEAGSGSGNLLMTASEETSGSFSPTKGTTYYVILTVDTGTGGNADLASGDNLDGTLTISVN